MLLGLFMFYAGAGFATALDTLLHSLRHRRTHLAHLSAGWAVFGVAINVVGSALFWPWWVAWLNDGNPPGGTRG